MPRVKKEVKKQSVKQDRAYYSRIGKMGREKQLAASAAKQAEQRPELVKAGGYDTEARRKRGVAQRDANLKRDRNYYKKLAAKAVEARKRKAAERVQMDVPPMGARRSKTADASSMPQSAGGLTISYNINCEDPRRLRTEPTVEMIGVVLATLFAVLVTVTLAGLKLAGMYGLEWPHVLIPGLALACFIILAAATTIIRRGYPQGSEDRE